MPREYQKIIPPAKSWTRRRLNQELKYSPPDLFFTPAYFIPRNAPKKSCALIHDVSYKSHPEKYSFRDRLNQNIAGWLNVKRAEKIFAVSERSKNEIIKYYHCPEKIVVAPHGYNRVFKQKIGQKKEKLIIYIGRIERKKSTDVLIKAFARLHGEDPGWKLALIGMPGYDYQSVVDLISKSNAKENITLTGYINDEEKWSWFSRAFLLVHPGSNEGGCTPLFEAWDSRTPAIISDTEALREIGREGALYFKPDDPDDLLAKIRTAIKSPELCQTLINNGEKILKEKSWKKTAEIILDEMLKHE